MKDVTDSLELVPVADLQVGFKLKSAEIEIQGKEVLEHALQAYQQKYAGYVVTEETLSDDTQVKNELGRVQRQIEQELKNQLADYSQPLDDAKAWVQGVLEPIKALQADIAEQIKEFESKATEGRKETVREAFREAVEQSGVALDVNLFAVHVDDLSKKKCFMADNVRLNQATVKLIADLVAEQVAKKDERDKALMQISETAAKAGFGPALYVKRFDEGANVADILQAILNDKALADEANAKAKTQQELNQRKEEMAVIAEKKGLNPKKYLNLLELGTSALEVHQILTDDAKELASRQQADSVTRISQISTERPSEDNHAQAELNAQNGQNRASESVGQKYGIRFLVELTFPAENARAIKEEFKQWLTEHGVAFEAKSKSEKVVM